MYLFVLIASYVLVNLKIQCDIVRPLPFFSSTHFSHYPRLMI